ncbi:hypothetical protein, partial [Sphingomonas faeni]|uniref:hypothetical protein n=1 Tax=Sphingomonas faeni TaxID=185950 RepID=UPI0020C007C5
LVIENHPYRPLADFGRKLVRRLARHGSTFSGVGASDKPGAVQRPWPGDRDRRDMHHKYGSLKRN